MSTVFLLFAALLVACVDHVAGSGALGLQFYKGTCDNLGDLISEDEYTVPPYYEFCIQYSNAPYKTAGAGIEIWLKEMLYLNYCNRASQQIDFFDAENNYESCNGEKKFSATEVCLERQVSYDYEYLDNPEYAYEYGYEKYEYGYEYATYEYERNLADNAPVIKLRCGGLPSPSAPTMSPVPCPVCEVCPTPAPTSGGMLKVVRAPAGVRVDYEGAKAMCESEGGVLGKVNNQAETDMVLGMLDGKNAWMGLDKAGTGAPWTWLEDGSPLNEASYTDWCSPSPSEMGGECVMFNAHNPFCATTQNRWSNRPCSTELKFALCRVM